MKYKEIGGYFELEMPTGHSYHEHAIALNTGRNALEYILRANGFRKIFLPNYSCHVVLQPIELLGISYEFYSIDSNFEPLFDFSGLRENDAFLYTNYYGLKDDFIQQLAASIPNLIVDNAQAFYSKPTGKVKHAFNSARKFFGVPDGAYAYTTKLFDEILPIDESYARFEHLLIRADKSAEEGYGFFSINDKALDNNPIKSMSTLTQKLLAGIPYEQYALLRRRNYEYLYEALKEYNNIDFMLPTEAVPMVYPFLDNTHGELRKKLIENRIYVAKYWPETLGVCPPESTEQNYVANLIPLPIDHRYTLGDMKNITSTIMQFL